MYLLLFFFFSHEERSVSGPSNAHAQPSCEARSPVPCLKFLLIPYILRANSESSGETVQMRKRAFAPRICYKSHFPMCRLI